jgi:hypothetical protein
VTDGSVAASVVVGGAGGTVVLVGTPLGVTVTLRVASTTLRGPNSGAEIAPTEAADPFDTVMTAVVPACAAFA